MLIVELLNRKERLKSWKNQIKKKETKKFSLLLKNNQAFL